MAPFRLQTPGSTDWGWPARLLLVLAVMAALYLGRDILAPLALALLLTIAALPVAEWLERRGVPRVPAVSLVLLLVVSALGTLLAIVVSQALALAAELPRYEQVLRSKLLDISAESGPITNLIRLGNRLGNAMQPSDAPATAMVTVAASPESPLSTLFGLLHVVLAPAATLAITLLLMAFLLIWREDTRDRILRLAGLHEMHRTTLAMGDATERVGQFLLMQLVVNGAFGAAMGLGLWALGVPNAPLWGIMGFSLRFVPYLGAPISALFPLIVAFATTEGWQTVILIVALFAVVDGIATYVAEPFLYGASTGVTPLALLLSSAFWAVLWGPIGLILAPAMTACLAILGRRVETFAFLDVLMGDTEPLTPPARFYQRILAGDARGAQALLEEASARDGVAVALQALALPAIAQISADRPSDGFGPGLALRAARGLLTVLDGVAEESVAPGDASAIALLPVAGALDRAAAAVLLAALAEEGHAAMIGPAVRGRTKLVVLVATAPAAGPRLRRALVEARASGARLLGFAAAEEAQDAFLEADAALLCLDGLPALQAAVEALEPVLEDSVMPPA